METSIKSEFLAGLYDTFPLVVGGIPFGIIFGAISVSSGLSPAGAMAMSAFVFAGSAQFIAVGLLASGAGGILIVLTTLIVNLRHSLYGITVSPYLRSLPLRWLIPLSFWLTDETFVVASTHFQQYQERTDRQWYMLGSSLFMYFSWLLCTLIGLLVGRALPNPAAWGLDFAMVVTFIGMLVPLLITQPMLLAALTAGVVSVVANPLPNRLGLFLATILGIAAGIIAEKLTRSPDIQTSNRPMDNYQE